MLVGTFDPSLVLREGYRPEHFWPGPLVRAMRDGGILYIEELNRAPSGALNVLITALSERFVDVAHLGRVGAAPGFMVVGSANPLDDVGTGRLSRGLLDRFLVVELGYQPRHEEIEIVLRGAPVAGERLAAFAVDLARRTRDHPDFRYGASIRAAIDLASLLAGQASELRGGPAGQAGRAGRTRSCCAAWSAPHSPGGCGCGQPSPVRHVDLVMELFSGLASETAGGLEVLLADAGGGTPAPALDDAGAAPADPGQDGAGQGGRDSRSRPDREELPGLERPGGSGEGRPFPLGADDVP